MSKSKNSTSLETRIRTLELREELKALRAKYCWYAARGDNRSLCALYAPDGVFESLRGDHRKRYSSRAEIYAFLNETLKMTRGFVLPLVHNHVIEVDGEEAFGTCVMESRLPIPNYPNGICGYYEDRARLVEGTLLFSSRRFFLYTPVFEDSGEGPV
jgi:hypothetical protein